MRTNSLPSILSASLTLVLAAGLGFVGCKKNDTDTSPPDATTSGDGDANANAELDAGEEEGEGEAEDSGGDVPKVWADMSRDERMTLMGTEVLPAMKEAFMQQGFDTFKCANCHGEDYKDVDFKMPNDLTPLNPDNPIQSGMDLDEEMTKFMVSQVLPQMAELLGKETDVTTGKGEFGCLSCHLSE